MKSDKQSRKGRLPDNIFWLKNGKEQYYKLCQKCSKNCKQSYKCTMVLCPMFEK